MRCSKCGSAEQSGAFCSSCGSALPQGTYQAAARGAIVSQNLALIGLVGLGLGFLGGAIVAAYVLFPMGGVWSLAGVFAPIIGMVVGYRLLLETMAR